MPRSRPNWTVISIIVGLVALAIAAGLYVLMVYFLLSESNATS